MRRLQSVGKQAFGALLTALMGALVLFTCTPGAKAQVENGINGTLTDPNGAVVAGAQVKATNVDTGVIMQTVTSSAGTYILVGLSPGHYSVVIEAPGFQSIESDVVVEVAKLQSFDTTLRPGAGTQTIVVRATSLSLNTTSSQLGTTLEPELVKNAPIEISGLARQIDSFMFLAPGVQGDASSHNINGGVTFENEVQFNGVPVAFVDYAGNQTYINPPYEAIDEFRVNSSTFDAQYGLGQGAVTFNMASGTNRLHGDAFEILRNQYFDSKGFFPSRFDANGRPATPINQQNNFGFTVGGPVILPKIYNGRDHTFFHVSADWFQQNRAETSIGTVPTAAMKAGDFSNFVDANGAQIPIYDPQTGLPFPNNMIPAARFSPLASSLLPSIPAPDGAGVNFGLQSNKSPAVSSVPIRQHIWAYTIDETLTPKQSVHFSQWHDIYSSPSFSQAPIVPTSNPLQSGINNTNSGSGFLLNYVNSLSQSLVVTAGVNAIGLINGEHNSNLHASFGAVAAGSALPFVTFDGQNAPTTWGADGGAFFACCEGGLTVQNNRKLGIVVVNNWLWSVGRNTFNLGGQFRRTYQDILACQFCAGTFNFSARTTSTPDSNDPHFGAYGSSFASFLLGQSDAAIRISSNEMYMRNKAFAFYAQDDVKLNGKLTVNAGFRWDILVPFNERNGNIIYVNPAEPNTGAGGILGAATKFGDCALCAHAERADIHWYNFQPRLGFAYQLSPRAVVHAGFYLTYLEGGAFEYGTAQSASFMGSLLAGQFLRGSTGGSTPGYGSWDANPLPIPQPALFTPTIANAGVIFAFNPKTDGKAPYVSAWNASVQAALPWNMVLTLAYVGNRAIHLPTTLKLSNQPNPSVLKYGDLLSQLVDSQAAIDAGIPIPYPEFPQQFGGSATVEQALTPFPQFGGYYPVYELDGTAFYNALQVQGEKRFSNNLSFLMSGTFGRLNANTAIGSAPFSPNGINAYNPGPEYSPSALDQRYATNIVATYRLPIGPEQRFLNKGGIVGQLLGGWQVSSILSYSDGRPFGAYNTYNPLLVNGGDRPNIVNGVKLKTFSYKRSKDFFTGKLAAPPVQFTTNAFANTGPWEVGNSKRTYSELRTPSRAEESFNLIKTFRLLEKVDASLRMDYFNAFNRTQLQEPDTNSLNTTFGQITNLSSQISNRQGQASFRIEF